jgi:hypothetical protein
MKRVLLSLLLVLTGSLAANALNYDDARERAWFLTDKMAYELNLTPEQYDMAYQVNLEYFLNIRTASDCTGRYWTYRNADLRYILFDWQYELYTSLEYFYRPIRWITSGWRFAIFDRYRSGYYYYNRPTVYVSYKGGLWKNRRPKDKSPFRDVNFRKGPGMRDNYNGKRPSAKPDYRPEFGKTGKNRPNVDRGYNKNDKKPNDNKRPDNKFDKNKKDNSFDRPANKGNNNAGKVNNNNSNHRQPTTTSRPSGNVKSDRNTGANRSNTNKSTNKTNTSTSGRTFGR